MRIYAPMFAWARQTRTRFKPDLICYFQRRDAMNYLWGLPPEVIRANTLAGWRPVLLEGEFLPTQLDVDSDPSSAGRCRTKVDGPVLVCSPVTETDFLLAHTEAEMTLGRIMGIDWGFGPSQTAYTVLPPPERCPDGTR